MTSPDVSVELLRRRSDGSLVPWLLNDDGSEPSSDALTQAKLDALTAVIGGTLDVFLTNLPSVQAVSGTVQVGNLPASYPLPTAQVTALTPPAFPATFPLPQAQVDALKPLTGVQTIALDAPTLAALENIQAAVTGTVGLDGPSLAALEQIVVSGTVALDTATLAALESITAAVTGTVSVSNLPTTQQVAGTVALDSTTLAALEQITAVVSGSVTVSGTVAVSNLPAVQTVTVNNYPATQQVAGTLSLDAGTLAALETTSVSVLGTVPVSGPLTDTQLRAAAVGITGSVIVTSTPGITDAQARATPLPFTPLDKTQTGTLTTAAADTTTGIAQTTGTIVVSAAGTSGFAAQIIATTSPAWVGSVITEYSMDNGATWTATAGRQSVTGGTRNSLSSGQVVTQGTYVGGLMRGSSGGATHYRVRQSARTAGSVTVNLTAHLGTAATFPNTIVDVREQFQYLCTLAGGRVGFNSTTDTIATGTAASLIGYLSNPTGSGVDLTIYRIEFGQSVAGIVRRFRNGTVTPAVGQVVQPAVNRAGGPAVAQSQFYARQTILLSTTAATGGNLSKVSYIGASIDDFDLVNGTLTLRPGENAYWTAVTATGTGTAALDVAWAETTALP